jgi:hypothetical protein
MSDLIYPNLITPPYSEPAGSKSFIASARTRDLARDPHTEGIEYAVYGDNDVAWQYVVRNPLLTEAHLRHLYPLVDYGSGIYFLTQHPNLPNDILRNIALSSNDMVRLAVVRGHPKASEETRAIIALKILAVSGLS